MRTRTPASALDWPPRRGARSACALVTLFALVSGIAPCLALERVVFHDLRSLDVVEARVEGEKARLLFEDGGELVVARAMIREVRDLPDPEPPTPSLADRMAGEPWQRDAEPYLALIEEVAEQHRLDAALVLSVARVESAFDPFALSPKGAQGLMQIMPGTAAELGLDDPFDAAANLEAGARWLRRLLDRYDGDLELALAAYNAGEGAVARHGGIPPYRETERYVRMVTELYEALSGSLLPGV